MKTVLVVFAAALALASAVPLLVEDEDGQQYYLTPLISRKRRDTAIDWHNTPQGLSGGGAATSHYGGGVVSYKNPNGSGGSVAYGHANGYGHDVKLTGSVPIWSNKNRYGETTLNAGGSVGKHYGGPWGNGRTDKQFMFGVNHRF